MFIGEYRHSLDTKNRIIVPAKYRELLGERFILTKGLDGCLFIYAKSEWQHFENKLKGLPLTNINARKFVRFFLAGATECSLDKQGRILIPSQLLAYAKIDKNIAFIGMSTRIELWSAELWDEYNNLEFDMTQLATQMEELGI